MALEVLGILLKKLKRKHKIDTPKFLAATLYVDFLRTCMLAQEFGKLSCGVYS